MGDRCYLSITIRKQDEEKFTEVLKKHGEVQDSGDDLFDEVADEDQTIRYTMFEANYGLTDEREQWAKEMTFYGDHGAGGGYGPILFVAYNGELIEVDSDWSGNPMVPVNPETGQPSAGVLAHVQRYLAAVKAINAQE